VANSLILEGGWIVPIDQYDLVDSFGESALRGNGALFIGAGMSAAAGLPDWAEILEAPRLTAEVPRLNDFPLMAEYISRSPHVGDHSLYTYVLDAICEADTGEIDEIHRLLSQLPVNEIWTTNYDQLIERACPSASVVISDDDIRSMGTVARTIIKMHGSIRPGPPRSWEHLPVLTRTSFETYEDKWPRTWALLRASYLSRTMLFLGLSFTDPNVDLLLRLARRHGTSVFDRHLTVMKRPDPNNRDALQLHNLRVADLENSGVRVCEIAEYEDLRPLLVALVRRTRPLQFFISGSAAGGAQQDIAPWCQAIASQLVSTPGWRLASLGGDAGWLVTRDVARTLRAEGKYDAAQLSFYFRAKNEPAPPLEERIGTAIYSDLERERLVPHVLEQCRALLVIRGGERSKQEIAWAQSAGVAVVPLSASGGASRDYWEGHDGNPPDLGGRRVDPGTWSRLNDENHLVAARAAHQLLRQGMYALERS
jgi:hypothetical protein